MKHSLLAATVGLSVCVAFSGFGVSAVQASNSNAKAASASATESAQARELLDRYCVTCHNERVKAGSLILTSVDVTRVGEHAELWETVVRKLRGRVMPPAGRPRPDDAAYGRFVAWLEGELDTFTAAHPNPGRPETLRRLNRVEYQNAIRDLLAIEIDAAEFVPADDAAHGFDNIGGVLKLSSTLMERYLSAANRISRMAMGVAPTVIDEGQVYAISGRVQQHDRIEGLPPGTRGGALVRHLFPQNAEYSFRIDIDGASHMTEPHTMELTVDGVQREVFTVERVGSPRDNLLYGDPEVFFEARVPVSAGPHEVGVTFYRRAPVVPESRLRPLAFSTLSNVGGIPGPGGRIPTVDALTIGGPFDPAGAGDTPSRRRLLTCSPTMPSAEDDCARAILSPLARRAFRRPVTQGDVDLLLEFYEDGQAEGGFEAGIEAGLRRLLVSPQFLFRMETPPAAGVVGSPVYQISDVELASRLSFFLWSSLPDDRLLDLAEEGRLQDPAVLEQEVRRMIADPRSTALTQNFAGQWLQLRKLHSSRPGGDYGKYYGETLKQGLLRETELFFDSIVREDRPVPKLLTADYTFLNERVAEHYGIRDVQGSHFRRVPLPADSARRGLLGHGSILTLTSQGIRTSPVTRGKYILETLMGTPPPEPPPDVPALEEKNAGGLPKTMRERMAAHRANPTCSACHSMIDPLGFALEHFDAVGASRTLDDGNVIDPSGALPDGREFKDVNELRALMMAYPEQLVTTLTRNLLTYALGRGLEYYDMPAVRQIVREAARDEYRFQSIVLGIVTSYPFQWRAVEPASPVEVSASR